MIRPSVVYHWLWAVLQIYLWILIILSIILTSYLLKGTHILLTITVLKLLREINVSFSEDEIKTTVQDVIQKVALENVLKMWALESDSTTYYSPVFTGHPWTLTPRFPHLFSGLFLAIKNSAIDLFLCWVICSFSLLTTPFKFLF